MSLIEPVGGTHFHVKGFELELVLISSTIKHGTKGENAWSQNISRLEPRLDRA